MAEGLGLWRKGINDTVPSRIKTRLYPWFDMTLRNMSNSGMADEATKLRFTRRSEMS